MVLLKYYHGLPGNKIRDIFKDFCGLTVTEGAIAKALTRLASYLNIEADRILEAIRQSAHKHADETGWKINGVGHWIWAFVNQHWAYFHINRRRAGKVPQELLGNPFKGVLISDFYSAYNRISGKKQKCLVHLRRELRKCYGDGLAPPDFQRPYKKFKRILSEALRLEKQRSLLPSHIFRRRVQLIKQRYFDFASCAYSNKHWRRIAKRLLKYEKDIFTFLDVKGLPSHNNPAEQAVRPHVILRNRFYQNRTNKGAFAHSVLTSLTQTLRLQNRDFFKNITSAYLAHRKGQENPVIFTSLR